MVEAETLDEFRHEDCSPFGLSPHASSLSRQLFRDYKAISPTATDDEFRTFIETKSIPQCGLCPSNRTAFVHADPLQRSALK